MKRFLKVVFLALFIVQLCLLPIAVEGNNACPDLSAVTLPATEIGIQTATLNGIFNNPGTEVSKIVIPNGVLLASLQNTAVGSMRLVASFQYGTEPGAYNNEIAATGGSADGHFWTAVSGLNPCTTYYCRVKLHMEGYVEDRLYQYGDTVQGAGVGLDYKHLQRLFNFIDGFETCPDFYGNEVSFRTDCPFIGPGGSGGGGTGATSTGPSNMSNIVVQSATVATAKVSPGESVDIAASVTNKGGSTGASKLTLYINGQEADSKGITLTSGQSTTVHFSVSRNDPGNYSVRVNGVPAGSFTVDLFTNNDALIFSIIALFTVGIVGVLYLVVKRRTA